MTFKASFVSGHIHSYLQSRQACQLHVVMLGGEKTFSSLELLTVLKEHQNIREACSLPAKGMGFPRR